MIFPSDLNARDGTQVMFQKKQYTPSSPVGSSVEPLKQELKDSVSIIAPGAVTDAIGAQWGPEAIFPGGEKTLNEFSKAGGDLSFKALTAGGMQAIYAQNKVFQDNMANRIGGAGAGATISYYKGQSTVPNQVMTYQGPAFQTFSLNVDMIPKNKDEAIAIGGIVKFFKASTVNKPEKVGLMMVLPYPCIYDISFAPTRGKSSVSTFTYYDMALTSFSVTYGAGANTVLTYKDGNVVQTSLSLSFQRIKLYDQGDGQ